jgi:hypothetical protein
MELIKKVSMWLAMQLDKLKVVNPVIFLIVQGILMALFTAFVTNTLNLPTPEWLAKVFSAVGLSDLDTLFTTILGLLVATVSPRTAQLKEAYLNGK